MLQATTGSEILAICYKASTAAGILLLPRHKFLASSAHLGFSCLELVEGDECNKIIIINVFHPQSPVSFVRKL